MLCGILLGAAESNQLADGEARGCPGGIQVRWEGGVPLLGPELAERLKSSWSGLRMQDSVGGTLVAESFAKVESLKFRSLIWKWV